MSIWSEAAIAALIVAAFWGIGSFLFTRLLCVSWRSDIQITVYAEGDANELEQDIHALARLNKLGIVRSRVVIVDDGLTQQGSALARQLVQRWDWVQLQHQD